MKNIFIITLSVFFVFMAVQAHATMYTFEWTGTVSATVDGFYDPVTMPDVSVGDSFTASLTYDTSSFGPGVDPFGDGTILDYAAPAGLQMTFQFESGGNYSRDIYEVRTADHGAHDQWNWNGDKYGTGVGTNPLSQLNDYSDSSWELPLPISFEEMHTLLLSSISNFTSATSFYIVIEDGDPSTDRVVEFDEGSQEFSISSAVPEPSTILLLGFGLAGVGLLRRRF
jgi:hypothetical protein